MKMKIIIALLLSVNSGVLGHIIKSDVELNDPCIASTKNNNINGYSATTYNGAASYCTFLGIKYATADRFKEAIPYVNPVKNIEAKTDPPKCTQFKGTSLLGQEDCLYLSIFTPDVNGSLPVMIFIPGAGFSYGSVRLAGQDPQYFMETTKIVVVTIQYRLGVLGLADFNSDVFPANLGMKDQVESMRWIKENIASFGGDPNKVTLMGQNSGAASVSLHMFSPLSKGLFRAGISESGTASATWAVLPKEWARNRLRLLAENVGCPVEDIPTDINQPADLTAECLRMKSDKELVTATLPFSNRHNAIYSFMPVIEKVNYKNTFLTEEPWTVKKMDQVPWLAGVNSNEEGMFIYLQGTMDRNTDFGPELNINMSRALYYSYSAKNPQQITSELEDKYDYKNPVVSKEVPLAAEALADGSFNFPNYQCHGIHSGSSTYNYYFNYVASADQKKRTIKGAVHWDELQYFLLRNGANIRLTGNELDKEISVKLVDLWVSFVVNSKPSADGIVWDAYSQEANNVLIIDDTGFYMGTDPNLQVYPFWEALPFRNLMS